MSKVSWRKATSLPHTYISTTVREFSSHFVSPCGGYASCERTVRSARGGRVQAVVRRYTLQRIAAHVKPFKIALADPVVGIWTSSSMWFLGLSRVYTLHPNCAYDRFSRFCIFHPCNACRRCGIKWSVRHRARAAGEK